MKIFKAVILVAIIVLSILLVVSLFMQYSGNEISLEDLGQLFGHVKFEKAKGHQEEDWTHLEEIFTWDEDYSLRLGSVDKQVLIDEMDMEIRLDDMYYTDYWGPGFELNLKNKGEDNINVQVTSLSVNGIMIDSYLSELVEAGDSFSTVIYCDEEDLRLAGIGSIKDVEISFEFLNEERWDQIYESGPIAFEVRGARDYVQEYGMPGRLIYDKEGISITLANLVETDYSTEVLPIYIENDSQYDVYVYPDSVFVNGKSFYVYFQGNIPANKKLYGLFYFFEDDLKKSRIKEIENIEFNISIINTETWEFIDETETYRFKL